ncbi:MAG: LysM peptidoglycan-binding domain-containing protein [Nitrospira sp.]|jgi:LysM repeat protein|nr:LysM peptidoglycan-binding domain-containing protein [Nitrospira sp.]
MNREGLRVDDLRPRMVAMGLAVVCTTLLLNGCVVLEEKYNAEKTRSLNFQRLLAQEEKRTVELDSEVKRTKKELAEFEARNRELSAQVQSAREQMGRLQEETEAIREAAVLERKAMEDMRKMSQSSGKAKKAEAAASVPREAEHSMQELTKDGSGFLDLTEPAKPASKTAPAAGSMVHVVKPGETLFRISRRYGVEIEKLKKWNKLPDDIIEVGQKLIVGNE